MPQLDFYHQVVKRALEKAGWRIIDQNVRVNIDDMWVYIDIIAESSTVTISSQTRIAVAIEVKSFQADSPVSEFEKALGQYLLYEEIIASGAMNGRLYLAIPKVSHESFFQQPTIQRLVARYRVNLLVYDPEPEEIVAWIN